MYISFCLMFCFFFFKQKTAYEMRISDWSSDVCSSDLAKREHACRQKVAFSDRSGHQYTPSPSYIKIGRASCRERVWSVRVDLGGRRIIKKKKNDTQKCNKRTAHIHTENTTINNYRTKRITLKNTQLKRQK